MNFWILTTNRPWLTYPEYQLQQIITSENIQQNTVMSILPLTQCLYAMSLTKKTAEKRFHILDLTLDAKSFLDKKVWLFDGLSLLSSISPS